MPVIRVTYPEGGLTDKQKEALAVPLIDAVMIQEVDPVNEVARNATFIVYNEIPKKNCYVSNEPFWLACLSHPPLCQGHSEAGTSSIDQRTR
jgi:phenylpyruvate tautomerase PptA (4-oxalocrotonate tautomerase family)